MPSAVISPVVLGTWSVMGMPTAPRAGIVVPSTFTVVHWQVGTAFWMTTAESVGLTSLISVWSFEPGLATPKSTSAGSPYTAVAPGRIVTEPEG